MIRLKALVAKKKEARLGLTGRSETSSPAGSAASTPREKDPKPEDGPKKGDGPEEGDGPKKGEDGPAPEPIEIPPMPSKDDVMALAKVYADADGNLFFNPRGLRAWHLAEEHRLALERQAEEHHRDRRPGLSK
mgnify:CR=1 FL=1